MTRPLFAGSLAVSGVIGVAYMNAASTAKITAPIVIAFAIAIRMTKTQAEIHEWHKR